MFNEFKTRATEEEIMDDFSLSGEDFNKTLRELTWINDWLGGNALVLQGMEKMMKNPSFKGEEPLKIIDLGCASGDTLRALGNWGNKKKHNFQLFGVDANASAISYAAQQASRHPIEYLTADVLSEDFSLAGYDLVICGLFLHHLTDEEQLLLLQKCIKGGVKGILVNDLHRHWLAYVLFWGLSKILNFSPMAQNDGKISIRKGFQKNELETIVKRLEIKEHQLRWKWAFRYQLLIFNNL